MTTIRRPKKKRIVKSVPEVWRVFLQGMALQFGKDSAASKAAIAHSDAILAAVKGRDDCYLFGHHRTPVVYRKPNYREHEDFYIQVTKIGMLQSGDEEDRAIRHRNAVGDYVRRMVVYPDQATLQAWLETKHDLLDCVKVGIDLASADVVDAELVKFSAPSKKLANQQ